MDGFYLQSYKEYINQNEMCKNADPVFVSKKRSFICPNDYCQFASRDNCALGRDRSIPLCGACLKGNRSEIFCEYLLLAFFVGNFWLEQFLLVGTSIFGGTCC